MLQMSDVNVPSVPVSVASAVTSGGHASGGGGAPGNGSDNRRDNRERVSRLVYISMLYFMTYDALDMFIS